MAESEDIPIIVHGGPHMVNVQIRRPNNAPPEKFSVEPDDPKVPFKSIVLSNGGEEVLRWDLTPSWRLEIV